MANETIDDQSALTAMANDDVIAIWDTSASAMKKITFSNFFGTDILMGSSNFFASSKVRAVSSAGLRLEDDAGNLGIFVQDATRFVGVGTASPFSHLHIYSSATGGTDLLFENADTGGRTYIMSSTGTASTGAAGLWQLLDSVTGNRLTFNGSSNRFGLGTVTPLSMLDVRGEVRGNFDTDTPSHFGRSRIGFNGTTGDWASFSHLDQVGASNFALSQSATGETWLNCAAAQNMVFARGGFSLGQWDTSGNLHPAVDNVASCGKSGSRWSQIWAGNATIQTSDVREKTQLKPSDLGLDFVNRLEPVSWVWADIDRPAVTEIVTDEEGNETERITAEAVKVAHKRPHYGLTAQQVKEVMQAMGVADFAGYIHDEATDVYGLRYAEFIGPIIKAIQELHTEIADLRQRILA